MASSTLPNGNGGYQISDGNPDEVTFQAYPLPVPFTATGAVTLTAAQLTSKILVVDPGGVATQYSLPSIAELNDQVPSARVGSGFLFMIVNVNSAGTDGIVLRSAGWGGGGTLSVVASTGATILCLKTSDDTWAAYRVG